MECGEDKLPCVPYISSLPPTLCGFQLPVSEQNSLFFPDVMVKSRNLIYLTWKKILFILVINKSKIKGILICEKLGEEPGKLVADCVFM